MALKATLTKEEHAKLAEPLREHYTEKDGKFVLDAEGIEDVGGLKSALQKERDARKKAADELRELADKYKDLDPAKAREAMKLAQEYEDKKMIDEGKVDELLTKKTERMKADYETRIGGFNTKIKDLEDTNTRLNGRLSEVLIEDALRTVALKPEIGFRPQAMPDLINRGRQIWKIVEGKPVPQRPDGSTIYGKDPNAPMTMEEWVTGLRADSGHLFGESGGGGTGGGGGKPTTNKKRSEMTVGEKTKFIGDHGQEEFLKLPA